MPPRRITLVFLGLLTPTLAVVALALLLMQWHKTTRVELTLMVDRVALTVAADASDAVSSDAGLSDATRSDAGPIELINWGRMRSVRIDRLARVTFAPGSLEMADESRFDLKANTFPDDAWEPIEPTGTVALEATDAFGGATPAVTLQAADADKPGVARGLRVHAGTRVVMDLGRESTGEQIWLTLELTPSPQALDLTFPARFFLFADYVRLRGAGDRSGAKETLALRTRGRSNTGVRVEGSGRGLVLQIEPAGSASAPRAASGAADGERVCVRVNPSAQGPNLRLEPSAAASMTLASGRIPVSAVDFTRQGPSGERRSTLTGPGTLRYPGLPAKETVSLDAGEYVSLGGLEEAWIESLGMGNEGSRAGLKVTLDAIANKVQIGTPEHPQDARLTWFDWLWNHPVLRTLFSIIAALLGATFAGYQWWQEWRTASESS